VTAPPTILWFVRHELRLAWRDWLWLMTAGGRKRIRSLIIGLVAVAAFMHAIAFSLVARFATAALAPDKTTLVVITGSVFLSSTLLLSQAMESVTRAFYSRADLDLLLSSPIDARALFAVRIAAIAASVCAMAALIASPFINVLAVTGGARWLLAYAAVAAFAMATVAVACLLTTALFVMLGPRRTRLVAQIIAAVIGAAFVIGLQLAAIASSGTLSRIALLASAPVVAHAPAAQSILWWPARAVLGELAPIAAMLGAGLALLAGAIAIVAPRFADCAIAATGAVQAAAPAGGLARGFRAGSAPAMLRRKERVLLFRDPWLVSQTLMQLLYLLPPAFPLWHNFGEGSGTTVLLVPVVVMAAGQLAGGLAWLAISGEDAPDLIATAPLTLAQILRAKIEAVLGVIVAVFAPFVGALALASPFHALIAGSGVAIAAASATQVQLSFRAQARRSQFRRRQTSSRIATFAEAFVSIAWAATAALAASGTAFAVMPGAAAVGILASAHYLAPQRA
jgi:ABC-2 type transport system permease protein